MPLNNTDPSTMVASSVSSSEHEESQPNLDLMLYWRSILNFKWHIAALSTVITVVAIMVALSLEPVYEASTTLLIESQKANTVSVEEVYGMDTGNRQYFQTQIEVLRSRRIAELLADEIDFTVYPEFDPSQQKKGLSGTVKSWLSFLSQPSSPPSDESIQAMHRQLLVRKIAQGISIRPTPNTYLVRASFESQSPALSALVANSIPVVYINSQLEAKMDMTQKVTSWLSERQLALRDTLTKAEQKLHAYSEANDLVDVQGVEGLASQELNQLTEQLANARRRLAQAESVYKVVRNKSGESLETLPEVLNHNLIQDAKRLEDAAILRVSELARRYGPKHPTLINAREELASIQAQMKGQVTSLVAGIENEYKLARGEVAGLENELATARQGFQKVSRKGSEFRELQREVEINRELYGAFLKRFTETSETSDFTQANARVTDQAMIPLYPIKPSRKLIVLGAFIMSLMFGVGLVVIYEFLHDGVRSAGDVEGKLSMRLLGLLPLISRDKDERLDTYVYFQNKERAFQEAVRSLRTSVVLSHIESSAKIITITSTLAAEGKSTVASNLAFALGQTEKVLLIDADLRKPSLGKMFELPSYHAGLANLIANTNSLAECLVCDELSGIDFMPSGAIPPNPQELLISTRFEKVLKALTEKYDRIIIDSAPTQLVSDSLLLARFSDSMLYVVKSDSTGINAIKRGIGQLLQVGARVDGVILNSVDTESAAGYGEYYYGGYGDAPDVQPAAAREQSV